MGNTSGGASKESDQIDSELIPNGEPTKRVTLYEEITSKEIVKEIDRFCICMIGEDNNDNENAKWVFCNGCKNWYHIQCVLLSETEHENIMKTNKKWFCDDYRCQEKENNFAHIIYPTTEIEQSDNLPTLNKENLKKSNNIKLTDEVKCFCGKLCKGQRGLSIHTSKAHKVIRNSQITESYQQTKINEKIEIKENDNNEIINESMTEESKRRNKHIEKCNDYMKIILNKLNLLENEFNETKFNEIYKEFVDVMITANYENNGPKHPSSKFYEMRKKKNKELFKRNNSTYKKTKNPELDSKRAREKRREKYNHQLMQHLYYNQRKKCVHKIFKESDHKCSIPINELHDHFTKRWGTANDSVRENYSPISQQEQIKINSEYDEVITEEEIEIAVKRVKNDSAPGCDGIYPRTMKTVKCYEVLAKVATLINKFNTVPILMRDGRTVLIYKDKGDRKDPNNWRPLTISSVIRRAIEKAYDKRLRRYLHFNNNQRGFTIMPGCHINSTILNGCLLDAQQNKKTLVIFLLDLQQAYDNLGHKHTEHALNEFPIPSSLRNIVMNLQINNNTRLETNVNISKIIELKRGIYQGAPTSPNVFNGAINFVINNLDDPCIKNKYGYKINEDLDCLSVLSFVDDTCTISNSIKSAIEMYNIVSNEFACCGLSINPKKSKAIVIEDGILTESDVQISESISIEALKSDEIIKYLGVTFKNEIIMDEAQIIKKFNDNMDILISTPMLYPEQKISIINQYIWPQLVYGFQTCPLTKLKLKFLDDIDKIVRNTLKCIIGLPDDIPTSMIYTSNKNKGMNLFRARWEAFIQTYSICDKLSIVKNEHLHHFRDLIKEQEKCLVKLNIPIECRNEIKNDKNGKVTAKHIREYLKEREYISWCNLPYKGKGVSLFSETQYANSWITNRKGLSSSEWITAIKMNGDVAAVRALKGRSQDGNRCRHVNCNEIETLAHVLGFCKKGELLRNVRHHDTRSLLADELKSNEWIVHEELSCIGDDDSRRRVDILAIKGNKGYIIDPTIRFENNIEQPLQVDREKKEIYDKCKSYFIKQHGLKEIEVIGLFIGARGTIPEFVENFRKKFKIKKEIILKIVQSVLKNSVKILNNHLHSKDQDQEI